ncbi:peptidase MA family metallohydrolase [Lihuaxuella thermophila]|uniref:Peptidase MA-like domain-containing protein n=1 Tax=Lihuaxuella thermophila TaxID=1173111 RepID=A0A1H8GBJ6_9BACL|nr:hypothetical protein [Lihuaxuella thermophila]SEN40688.1 hypothetical protein SAMN05444955_110161 [Lihuaxuella thermophila]
MLRRGLIHLCILLLISGISQQIWLAEAYAEMAARPDSDEKMVRELVKQKEQAVNQRKWRSYLRLLDPAKKMYIQEQKRWFQDAVQYIDAGSFRLKVLSVVPLNKDQMCVWVHQSYTKNGKMYAVKFPLLFLRTRQGWKDADLAFKQLPSDFITVYYSDSSLEDQAHIALDTLNKAVYVFKQRFDWSPARIEVKLYHDPELFRQSVKPSLPSWAGGWHEAGESIKLIGGLPNSAVFASGLVHELTHQMVSELTNDNAAYWLQEGAAMYYELHLLPGLHDGYSLEWDTEQMMSVSELEHTNLERLSPREAARYYQTCYRLFSYLIETYGDQQIQKVFSVLRKSPPVDVDSSQKLRLLNEKTGEAVREVLGISMEELDRNWRRTK